MANTQEAALKTFYKANGFQCSSDEPEPMERLPSGSLALDVALGGGYPRGRFMEIYGQEGTGKTLLALLCVAAIQRQGYRAVFIDAEHAFDAKHAAELGVDTTQLPVKQPDSGEDALQAVEAAATSGLFDLIVVDSVASLVPKAEIDGEIGDQTMGLQARMLSQAMRTLTPTIGKSKAFVIFVNQLRQKVGMVFGNPFFTPGGMALKFYSSIRIEAWVVSKSERKNEKGEKIGHDIRAKIIKNKTSAPFREAIIPIEFKRGILPVQDLVNAGIYAGVIQCAEKEPVKYLGTAFGTTEVPEWKKLESFGAWAVDPANAEMIAKIRAEILAKGL
jgi:recombination protein RecA